MESTQSKAVGKKGPKKIKFETTFSADIFDFLTQQFEGIQDALQGEKLIMFISRMIEQLVSLIEHVVSESMKFEVKSPKSMIELVIRLNDLKKVSQEFSRF